MMQYMQYSLMALYDTIQYNTVQDSMIHYGTFLYDTVDYHKEYYNIEYCSPSTLVRISGKSPDPDFFG